MSYSTADLWKFFEQGPKQNMRHYRAICKGCIAHYKEQPKYASTSAASAPTAPEQGTAAAPVDVDTEPAPRGSQIVREKERHDQACTDAGSVNGEKSAMIAHILGARPPKKTPECPHASDRARKVAQAMRDSESAQKRAHESGSDDDTPTTAAPKKKKQRTSTSAGTAPPAPLKQEKIKRYKAVDIPFSEQDKAAIQAQALLATVSGHLPFTWLENTQVRKLLGMLRSRVDDVIPSRFLLSGRLLDDEHDVGEKDLMATLRNQSVGLSTDGWKDDFGKDSVAGVNISFKHVPYLVDVIKTTSHKKDGPAMCLAFEAMIDKAEQKYGCIVRFCCTDCDGASKAGRKELVVKRPWIFGPPCWAHQWNLYLADYLAENPAAAACGDQVADILGWINNHSRVRSVFNDAQASQADTDATTPTVYTYLVANTTRWTTHFVAFTRMLQLKDILRQTAITKRRALIEGHVGAAKGKKAREFETAADAMCDILDDPSFWRTLQATTADFEPICLGVNINQRDSVRLDEVLLSIAGMFLHFKAHSIPSVRTGMVRRIEARWKDMGKEQSIFILALVLNPYEKLARFGPKAALTPFTLNTLFVETYLRMHSRPLKASMTTEEKLEQAGVVTAAKDAASKAFFQYLASTGPFADFEANSDEWRKAMGDDPAAVWEAMLCVESAKPLTEFTLIILDFVANQAGNERNFSDFKINKTRLRNRLGINKLEKLTKVGDRIRRSEIAEGTRKERARKLHDQRAELLAVPRYADTLDLSDTDAVDDAEAPARRTRPARLVTSAQDWRREMARWQADRQAEDLDSDDDDDTAPETTSRVKKGFIPCTLERLFGDAKPRSRPKPALSHEERYMELLRDELVDTEKILDDGEKEGSGDDYNGDD